MNNNIWLTNSKWFENIKHNWIIAAFVFAQFYVNLKFNNVLFVLSDVHPENVDQEKINNKIY